jgi:hypothetical protein
MRCKTIEILSKINSYFEIPKSGFITLEKEKDLLKCIFYPSSNEQKQIHEIKVLIFITYSY